MQIFTSAKFQKDRTKTVEGVASTKYPLIASMDGGMDGQMDDPHFNNLLRLTSEDKTTDHRCGEYLQMTPKLGPPSVSKT